jgi:hypothetical protein
MRHFCGVGRMQFIFGFWDHSWLMPPMSARWWNNGTCHSVQWSCMVQTKNGLVGSPTLGCDWLNWILNHPFIAVFQRA